MKFWKDHPALRIILIALFFVVGMTLLVMGWKMQGNLTGLGIMIVGLCLLLAALYIYNKPYNN